MLDARQNDSLYTAIALLKTVERRKDVVRLRGCQIALVCVATTIVVAIQKQNYKRNNQSVGERQLVVLIQNGVQQQ